MDGIVDRACVAKYLDGDESKGLADALLIKEDPWSSTSFLEFVFTSGGEDR